VQSSGKAKMETRTKCTTVPGRGGENGAYKSIGKKGTKVDTKGKQRKSQFGVENRGKRENSGSSGGKAIKRVREPERERGHKKIREKRGVPRSKTGEEKN